MGTAWRDLLLNIIVGAVLMLAPAHADEACERFMSTVFEGALAGETSNHQDPTGHIETVIKDHIDLPAITRFTLGKYAGQVPRDDLATYQNAPQTHLSTILAEQLQSVKGLNADILTSVDRNPNDCFVETVIHSAEQEDVFVIWRVRRSDQTYRILDLALNQAGSRIWLGIELRAQVMALYEQSRGDIGFVIERLDLAN